MTGMDVTLVVVEYRAHRYVIRTTQTSKITNISLVAPRRTLLHGLITAKYGQP